MVAPKERRIEMEEVVSSLSKLNEWTSIARGNVLDDESRQLLINLRKKVQQNSQEKIDAAKAKADRDALIGAAQVGIAAVIKGGLSQAAAEINEGGDLVAEVSEELLARGFRFKAVMYRIIEAIRLSASIDGSSTQYELYVLFCEKHVTRVKVIEFNAPKAAPASDNDTVFALIPAFSVVQPGVPQPTLFFVADGQKIPLARTGPDLTPNIQNRFSSSSIVNAPIINKITAPEFSLSNWPDVQSDISKVVGDFVKTFLKDVLFRQV
jgi:hypothetical protein